MIAPQRLTVAVEAITKRLQLEILTEELPLLASTIKDDRRAGARTDESAQAFVTACDTSVSGSGQLQAKDVRRLMSLCAVGKERLDSEFGTDRLSTIAAQAVALTVSSVREQRGWFASRNRLTPGQQF